MRICEVDGCSRKHWARGLCNAHYQRQRIASNPPCSVEGCEINSKSLGLCNAHHMRQYLGLKADGPIGKRRNAGLTSDVEAPVRRYAESRSDEEYLAEYSERQPDGCILWTGTPDRHLYGRWLHGQWEPGHEPLAHRKAYTMAGNTIPEGWHVHHVCGVKTCVNPDHLEAMSASDHQAWHRFQRQETGDWVVDMT